jgi:uncharacterized protein (TIGR03083 family)
MALSEHPAQRHRQIGGLFTERVLGTRDWDAPSPVPGWAARDVVRHLTGWFPPFLSAGAGIELPAGPPVDEDPVSAWRAHCDAVQALLDDPATQDRVLANPHTGELPLDRAVDQFYTADVFMHTWDLARATGQTTGWTPASAPSCWPAWSGSNRPCAPLASTGPGSRCPRTPDPRSSCWASSAATPSGLLLALLSHNAG